MPLHLKQFSISPAHGHFPSIDSVFMVGEVFGVWMLVLCGFFFFCFLGGSNIHLGMGTLRFFDGIRTFSNGRGKPTAECGSA